MNGISVWMAEVKEFWRSIKGNSDLIVRYLLILFTTAFPAVPEVWSLFTGRHCCSDTVQNYLKRKKKRTLSNSSERITSLQRSPQKSGLSRGAAQGLHGPTQPARPPPGNVRSGGGMGTLLPLLNMRGSGRDQQLTPSSCRASISAIRWESPLPSLI